MCAINAESKICKSMIKKKTKKLDKIVLLAKTKLNTIEVLISKAIIDSFTRHDEFFLLNNVLREYDDMKKKKKSKKFNISSKILIYV